MAGKTDILTTPKGQISIKRLEFTKTLYHNTRPNTKIQKLKRKYLRTGEKPLPKSQWKERMGTTRNDYEAGERYIQDLKDSEVLKVEDERQNVDLLSFDRNRLLEKYFESRFFQDNLQLNIETIQKKVKGRTVSHEVYIENDFPRINKAISKIKAFTLL